MLSSLSRVIFLSLSNSLVPAIVFPKIKSPLVLYFTIKISSPPFEVTLKVLDDASKSMVPSKVPIKIMLFSESRAMLPEYSPPGPPIDFAQTNFWFLSYLAMYKSLSPELAVRLCVSEVDKLKSTVPLYSPIK